MKDVRTLATTGKLTEMLAGIRELFQHMETANRETAA
jgi:hypothetical protein